MTADVEKQLMVLELEGVSRLDAIQLAIKAGKLRRKSDGSLEAVTAKEQGQDRRSLLGI
jgi:hypothetical protein